SGRERAEAHLALATALAASGNADDAAIARHMVEAVPLVSIEAALECVFGAARAALRTVAHEDAISLLGGALALDLAPRQRAAVLTDLGAAFAVAGLAADCTRVCTEAAAIGQRLGDDELVVQAALRSAEATWRAAGRDPAPAAALLDEALRIERRPVERARLLGAMSAVMAFAGDQPSARRRRDEALSLAEPLGDPQLLLDVIHSGLYCEVVPEEVDQQLELCRRGSRLAEEQGDDVALLKLSAKAVLRLTVKPEPEWLRAELARSDRLARRLRDPYYLLANHGFQVLQALSEGRFDDAERAALSGRDGWADFGQDADVGQGVQMFSIRREQGRLRELRAVLELGARLDPAAAWKPGLAALYTEIGLVERAGEVVDEACTDRLRSVARDSVYPAALSYLAEAAAVAGRREAAAVIADELGPYAGMYLSVPGLVCYGSADRYLGMLAECLGDLSGARAHLEAAVGIDEAAGWPVWAAHSQHALGSLLLRTGPTRERRRGVSLVKAALDIARSLGMGALAERGEAALASADAGGAASAPAPAGTTLTRREREVLGLVAEGLTNRQIGQRLFASPHTIANHVRSILAKTGSGNRTEAAAWAHRAGLVGRHARSDSD
ncbi:MAG: helix-turn-helix transcriptional regulator, partial [Acidimicrobiia bacterium]|nr:helix-turn-helix transcriptional regulator [Acidimicrobiia bacterium]